MHSSRVFNDVSGEAMSLDLPDERRFDASSYEGPPISDPSLPSLGGHRGGDGPGTSLGGPAGPEKFGGGFGGGVGDGFGSRLGSLFGQTSTQYGTTAAAETTYNTNSDFHGNSNSLFSHDFRDEFNGGVAQRQDSSRERELGLFTGDGSLVDSPWQQGNGPFVDSPWQQGHDPRMDSPWQQGSGPFVDSPWEQGFHGGGGGGGGGGPAFSSPSSAPIPPSSYQGRYHQQVGDGGGGGEGGGGGGGYMDDEYYDSDYLDQSGGAPPPYETNAAGQYIYDPAYRDIEHVTLTVDSTPHSDAEGYILPPRQDVAQPWDQPDPSYPRSASKQSATRTNSKDRSSQGGDSMTAQNSLFKNIVQRSARSYTNLVPGRCPVCTFFVGLVAVLVVIALGMVTVPPEVETDFSAFLQTDVNSSVLKNVFDEANDHRSDNTKARRLATSLYKTFNLNVFYELNEDTSASSIFETEIFRKILLFEAHLTSGSLWQAICSKSESGDIEMCSKGISMANYALASPTMESGEVVPSALKMDGRGDVQVPFETTIQILESQGIDDVVLSSSFSVQDKANAQYIRTLFRFKLYCCTSDDSSSVQSAILGVMQDDWETFVVDELIPTIASANSGDVPGYSAEDEGEAWPLRMWYSGSSIKSIEIMNTLMGDMYLAGGSMIFVLAYLTIHTRSMLLSFFSLFLVSITVPLSYVITAVLTGTTTMHVASFLSLFLIVGLGSDVVFVFTDYWRHSAARLAGWSGSVLSPKASRARLAWTLYHAGKASLATSATTALSFFANLASVLKPLREFGFFMGLCVMLAWVIIAVLYLPLLYVDERYFACCRISFDCKKLMTRGSASKANLVPVAHVGSPRNKPNPDGWIKKFVRGLSFIQYFCIAAMFLATAACLILSVLLVEVGTGLPSIFPEDHNQNKGQDVSDLFTESTAAYYELNYAPSSTIQVCNTSDFSITSCSLFWCEADTREGVEPEDRFQSDVPVGEVDTCRCFRRAVSSTGCDSATYSQVWQRWTVPSEYTSYITDLVSSGANLSNIDILTTNSRSSSILQEWESGVAGVMSVIDVYLTADPIKSGGYCNWYDMCSCGQLVCSLQVSEEATQVASTSTWSQLTDFDTPETSRLLQSTTWTVASGDRAYVWVVFGIEVLAEPTLLGTVNYANGWAFLSSFDMSHHWTQRNLLAFCTDLPSYMRVTSQACWIQDFKTYVTDLGYRFPVPYPETFTTLAADFISNGHVDNGGSPSDYLWVRSGEVRASKLGFTIDVATYGSTATVLKHLEYWDSYTELWNLQAEALSRGAWHVSVAWVVAEAQSRLISSTAATLGIVLVLAFFGMLAFTRDASLSFFVVLATIGVISVLMFFIIVIMGWEVGAIEVLALIVFIGYAVTYSLHIAHCYGSHEISEITAIYRDAAIAALEKASKEKLKAKKAGAADGGAETAAAACAGPAVEDDAKVLQEEQHLEAIGGSGSFGYTQDAYDEDDFENSCLNTQSEEPEIAQRSVPLLTAEQRKKVRFLRVAHALESIGGAAVGSSITTIGCAVFLLFCTMTIFTKLGAVVLVVTVMSITFALGPLSALLLVFGPLRPGSCVVAGRAKNAGKEVWRQVLSTDRSSMVHANSYSNYSNGYHSESSGDTGSIYTASSGASSYTPTSEENSRRSRDLPGGQSRLEAFPAAAAGTGAGAGANAYTEAPYPNRE